jgi:hypothetical protein
MLTDKKRRPVRENISLIYSWNDVILLMFYFMICLLIVFVRDEQSYKVLQIVPTNKGEESRYDTKEDIGVLSSYT